MPSKFKRSVDKTSEKTSEKQKHGFQINVKGVYGNKLQKVKEFDKDYDSLLAEELSLGRKNSNGTLHSRDFMTKFSKEMELSNKSIPKDEDKNVTKSHITMCEPGFVTGLVNLESRRKSRQKASSRAESLGLAISSSSKSNMNRTHGKMFQKPELNIQDENRDDPYG